MDYRNLMVAAVLATGLSGFWAQGPVRAETIAVENGIAVKESDVATPNATPESDTHVMNETKKLCSRARE